MMKAERKIELGVAGMYKGANQESVQIMRIFHSVSIKLLYSKFSLFYLAAKIVLPFEQEQ